MNKIEEAIEGHWGERCSETMEGCPCCEAWHQYDMMKWRSERPEPLGKWDDDQKTISQMDSAPTDGTNILAYFPDDVGWLRVSCGIYGWQLSPDGGTEFAYEIEGHPTHWMHLPSPPEV